MADEQPANLGEYIRRQRELHAMSMRQVAEMAGISNPYLSQIERGLREPSEQVIDAIARSLELSAEKLYEQAGRTSPGDEEPSEVEAAIGRDPRLNARQRQALLEVYRSFAGRRAGRRPG
jgi:transcriptional regulator with XRE-family HTH domain